MKIKGLATALLAVTVATGASAQTGGFKTLESGLQYKLIKKGDGTHKAQLGDHLEMHIHVKVNDSMMFDSRVMNAGRPVPFVLNPATFKGDPVEGFMMMVAGDSMLFRLPVDSLMKQQKQLAPGMKAGDMLNYEVVLVSAVSDADFKKQQEEAAGKQKSVDEQLIKAFLDSKGIKAKSTPSGIYYTISTPGTGANATNGQTVVVNYSGRLLGSDKPFDSNTDPEFHHTEPFSVVLGTGGVIKGWEEGLALLKKGSKATLYIPSGLAYGAQDRSPMIPANSVLVFDIEVKDIMSKDQAEKKRMQDMAKQGNASADQAKADEKTIKEYITKNKLKAQRTSSGLYYVIKEKGTGPNAKAGEKVAVKYNGTFLDGKKFDGNMDRDEPFRFTLGQGMVIRGWDEGIALLNKGAKATLLLPSAIAYGPGGTGPIPPNTVLLFDVELVDISK